MNTKTIKFDLNKYKLYEKIKAKQGDTKSRFLLFQLLDGSVPFNLKNRSVRAYMIKPDGKEIFNDLIVNNYNLGYCTLELTNQVLAVPGTVKIELMVTEEEKKLTSSVFEVEVVKSINSEKSIVSTNEFTALLNGLAALSEYDNYKNAVKEMEINKADKAKVEEKFGEVYEQLETKASEIRNINLPQNYNGGVAVFVDDDAYSTVMDKWVNGICTEKDIKISIGVISKYTYNADKLNVTQLKELQTQGYDLLSHSHEHINLNNATVEQAENDFVQDHNWWISNGFEVPKTLVYPWGLNRANEEMKNIVRKYYSYGLHSATNFNRIPLDNMWVQRVDLARKTLDELKQEVTNAYYNNGLVVFYTHSQYPEGDGSNYFPTQKIKDLIDYIKTVRKMPIMTFSEAIKLKGNVIQAGEGSKYDRFFALSNDGRVSMPQNVNIVKDRSYHINTSIVNFPDKTLSIVAVSQEDDTIFNKGGNLFIYRYDTGNGFEMYMPNGTVDVYKRNWTYGASNWEPFIDLHPKNSTERITLTTDDLGSLSANTLKKVQKTLSTNLNLNNYIIIVNPIGCPYNIMWSYGINYNNKTIEFSLLSPMGTTPSAGINYDISFVPKS